MNFRHSTEFPAPAPPPKTTRNFPKQNGANFFNHRTTTLTFPGRVFPYQSGTSFSTLLQRHNTRPPVVTVAPPAPLVLAAAPHHSALRNGPLNQVITPRPYRPPAARCPTRRTSREKFNLRVFFPRCLALSRLCSIKPFSPSSSSVFPLSLPFPVFSISISFHFYLSGDGEVHLAVSPACYTRPTQPPTPLLRAASNV